MSDSTHTQGRLVSRGFSIYAADGKTPVADTCLNGSVADNDEANARRLVAAWNACADIPTYQLLAESDKPNNLGEMIDGLRDENAALRAEVERLRADAIKSERRAIEYSDIIQHHVIVMRAAVVASSLYDSGEGMLWIKNTLLGPGHYPNIESARELGGAQALFDKEMAEHEAFRAAHPLPAIPAALKGGA